MQTIFQLQARKKSIVDALRHARTFATNGGPLFPFWQINNTEVGGTVTTTEESVTARLEIRSRDGEGAARFLSTQCSAVERTRMDKGAALL